MNEIYSSSSQFFVLEARAMINGEGPVCQVTHFYIKYLFAAYSRLPVASSYCLPKEMLEC